MKLIKTIVISAAMIFSSAALAHSGLVKSSPAKNEMLQGSPQTLALTFSSPVRLVKLTLKDGTGNDIKFGFKPNMQSSKQFSLDLPQLAPSSYSVSWMIMGEDAHKMKGKFGFMVHEVMANTTEHDHASHSHD
ncbi:putative copper resistance (CopC-like) protein [Shewanella benthica]|uniref:Copper resistance protein C n=1 Tax=Shewanella benthica TaxID=43661 RepID=A0A330M501_9GAMM|nr:copper resistance CopC family protein [Shewanella benthica]SQH76494.1 putative copper resistance (CopC-like) protein [Shewanella benthica]